jgi:hypothetical protein
MESNFTFEDFVTLRELLSILRNVTKPRNDHVDSILFDYHWSNVDKLLEKLNYSFVDKIITKEFVEDLIGKKIVNFEKEYDDNGKLVGLKVQPVQVVENIMMTFTISPTGVSSEETK